MRYWYGVRIRGRPDGHVTVREVGGFFFFFLAIFQLMSRPNGPNETRCDCCGISYGRSTGPPLPDEGTKLAAPWMCDMCLETMACSSVDKRQ